jgi:ferredoxin
MPILVKVDAKKCGANGQCWQVAPRAFRLGADMVAEVLEPDFPASDLPLLQAAEGTCPTGAISVIEA